MYKLSLIFLIVQCAFPSDGLQNLCEGTCLCSRITDEDLNIPVTIVDCARRDLQVLPDKNQIINDVNYLDLSFNGITSLNIDDQDFSSERLQTLSISYNNITYISDEFFDQLPNLQKLDLSHNKLREFESASIFKNLANLNYLDLSFNELSTIPPAFLTVQKELQYLDLSYNNLGSFFTQDNRTLDEILGLGNKTSHIIMNNLGLIDLPAGYFDSFPDLKYLSITDNFLKTIPSNIPLGVEYLDVSGNDMTVINVKQLSSYHALKILYLNRLKKLQWIENYAFYNLLSLEVLSITDCPNLQKVSSEMFGLLKKSTKLTLKKLSLARNSLKSLNYTYGYLFDHLDYIDLTGNAWKCDCNLLWLQEHDFHLHANDDVRCFLPPKVRKKKVSEIIDGDVPECYPEKYGKKSHRILIPILLILILTLSALIGYLIYYAPNLGNRSRGVGPQSPYNPTRLVEVN